MRTPDMLVSVRNHNIGDFISWLSSTAFPDSLFICDLVTSIHTDNEPDMLKLLDKWSLRDVYLFWCDCTNRSPYII